MRAGSRPGPSPAGGEEEGRGQKAASQEGGEEGGNRPPEEGERQRARGEEEGRGRPRGPEAEGRRAEEEGGGRPGGPEEEGGQCAERRKRSPEEGKRAAEEDRCPTAAESEGEEVEVRLVGSVLTPLNSTRRLRKRSWPNITYPKLDE